MTVRMGSKASESAVRKIGSCARESGRALTDGSRHVDPANHGHSHGGLGAEHRVFFGEIRQV